MLNIFQPHQAPSILIVDDDPIIVDWIADKCGRIGFRVETATSGVEALNTAYRMTPDIVIADINIPDLDGFSLCTRLLFSLNKRIELMVITGSTDLETVKRCEAFGAFYGHKGPDFLNRIEAVLSEIYPNVVQKAQGRDGHVNGVGHERPIVLVVDDDPAVEVFLARGLDKCGVSTLAALDSVQGYEIACKEKPSAVVSDYTMPKGGVLYLLDKLRSTPSTENIPVFLLSGRRLDDLTALSLQADVNGRPGVAQSFRKSSNAAELFETLQKVCGFRDDWSKG